jgi:hypothetical protein
MSTAASSPRSAPKAIFSTATSEIGIGASSRSSISRVQAKSMTSGKATACRPPKNAFSAISPASMISP